MKAGTTYKLKRLHLQWVRIFHRQGELGAWFPDRIADDQAKDKAAVEDLANAGILLSRRTERGAWYYINPAVEVV